MKITFVDNSNNETKSDNEYHVSVL